MNSSKEKIKLLKYVNPFALFLGKMLSLNIGANISFVALKTVILTMNDRPRSGTPRKFGGRQFENVVEWKPISNTNRTVRSSTDQATVSRRLRETGKIQKLGKWMPYELSRNNIIRRLSTCVSLLSRHRKKRFFCYLLLAMKNGLCMIILNVDIRGWTPDSLLHQSFAVKRSFCVFGGMRKVIYYELLQPGETFMLNATFVNWVVDKIEEKRPFTGQGSHITAWQR